MLNYIKIYDIEEEDQFVCVSVCVCVCFCLCVCQCVYVKPELGDCQSRESNHLQDF